MVMTSSGLPGVCSGAAPLESVCQTLPCPGNPRRTPPRGRLTAWVLARVPEFMLAVVGAQGRRQRVPQICPARCSSEGLRHGAGSPLPGGSCFGRLVAGTLKPFHEGEGMRVRLGPLYVPGAAAETRGSLWLHPESC